MFQDYLGSFDEAAVRDNFVLIYELLDELLDYGYPQHTGPEVLKLYVTQKGLKNETKKMEEIKKRFEIFLLGPPNILAYRSALLCWFAVRKQCTYKQQQTRRYNRRCIVASDRYQIPKERNIHRRYRKGTRNRSPASCQNTDIITFARQVNVLMSPKGTILESDVSGNVQIKCQLSGMPECRFGLNDKLLLEKEASTTGVTRKKKAAIQLDDVSFHQCVKLAKFDTDRVVSFVPPDGEFDLMKYRTTVKQRTNKKPNALFESLFFALTLILYQYFRTTHTNDRKTSTCRFDCCRSYASSAIRSSTRCRSRPTSATTSLRLACSSSCRRQRTLPPLKYVVVPIVACLLFTERAFNTQHNATPRAQIKVGTGKAKYVAAESAIVWKISKFIGAAECTIGRFYFLASVFVG